LGEDHLGGDQAEQPVAGNGAPALSQVGAQRCPGAPLAHRLNRRLGPLGQAQHQEPR
jgi:hypothetical protein